MTVSPRPMPVLGLVGLLIGTIAAGAAAFIGVLTVVVIAGGDYLGPKNHGHYLYPHTFEVIVDIAAGAAAVGVAAVTLWWLTGETTMRRLAIALAAAALALLSIGGLTGYLDSHAGADPRLANAAHPRPSRATRVSGACSTHMTARGMRTRGRRRTTASSGKTATASPSPGSDVRHAPVPAGRSAVLPAAPS